MDGPFQAGAGRQPAHIAARLLGSRLKTNTAASQYDSPHVSTRILVDWAGRCSRPAERLGASDVQPKA